MGVHRNQWCNRIFWLLILIVFIWLHPEHAVFLHMINNIWHCSSPLCIPSIPAAINSMYGKETRKPIRYGVGWPKICGSIPNMGTRFFPPKYPGLSPGPTHPFPCAVAVTNLSSVVQSTCNTKLTTHHLRLHYKDGTTLPIPNTPLPSWFKCLITHRNSFTCGSWENLNPIHQSTQHIL